MFCPVCRAEYRDGMKICGDCRVALVEDLENLPELIEGEVRYCPVCEVIFSEERICPECGVPLARGLLSDDRLHYIGPV